MGQFVLWSLVLLAFFKVFSVDAALTHCYSDRLSWQFGQYCIEANFHEIDWDDARADCKRRGGDLLEVRSSEMQQTIEYHLKKSGHHPAGYWFGATDRNHEGRWEWLHDNKRMTYDHWNSEQGPHQTGFFFSDGRLEDCAMIRPDDGYKWHDGPCAGGIAFHYASLCQYDLIITTVKPTYIQTSKPTQKATTVKQTTNVPHTTEAPTYAKTSKPTQRSTTVNPTTNSPTLMSILSTQKSTILTQPPFPTGTIPPKTSKTTAEIDTTAPPPNTPPVTSLPTTMRPTTTTAGSGVIIG